MGYVCEFYINRECEECVYSELDVFEQKYWCNLREDFRDPKDAEACPDIKTS